MYIRDLIKINDPKAACKNDKNKFLKALELNMNLNFEYVGFYFFVGKIYKNCT